MEKSKIDEVLLAALTQRFQRLKDAGKISVMPAISLHSERKHDTEVSVVYERNPKVHAGRTMMSLTFGFAAPEEVDMTALVDVLFMSWDTSSEYAETEWVAEGLGSLHLGPLPSGAGNVVHTGAEQVKYVNVRVANCVLVVEEDRK
jgi:hypothetical protein